MSESLSEARLAEIRAWAPGHEYIEALLAEVDRLRSALATNERWCLQIVAERDAIERSLIDDKSRWHVLHELMECGHPRACWQDRNYPESEKNYNPMTKTGEPPIDYRCVACESESSLRSALTTAEGKATQFDEFVAAVLATEPHMDGPQPVVEALLDKVKEAGTLRAALAAKEEECQRLQCDLQSSERCETKHVAERDAAREEVERLKGVVAQHDLCHDLHGKVGADDFAKGCAAEQRRIFGKAPHVDALNAALAALRRWIDARNGCNRSMCNIGGGLCSECSIKSREAEEAARAILSKHPETVAAAKRHCEITKNECGTDTWMVGRPCPCPQCQAWLQERGETPSEDPQWTQIADGKSIKAWSAPIPAHIQKNIQEAIEEGKRERGEKTPERNFRDVPEVSTPNQNLAAAAQQAADMGLYEGVDDEAPTKLLRRWFDFYPNCAQLLDGWHQDGTAWSEWDESVRKELTEIGIATGVLLDDEVAVRLHHEMQLAERKQDPKFLVYRVSNWEEEQPCPEAIKETIQFTDVRCAGTLAEASTLSWYQEWYENGTNHREEDGRVVCDSTRTVQVWTMHMSLLRIPEFVRKYGPIVISASEKYFQKAKADLQLQIFFSPGD